jgi:hypothetical protein
LNFELSWFPLECQRAAVQRDPKQAMDRHEVLARLVLVAETRRRTPWHERSVRGEVREPQGCPAVSSSSAGL